MRRRGSRGAARARAKPDMHETEVDAGMRAAYLSSQGSRLTSAVLPENKLTPKGSVIIL